MITIYGEKCCGKNNQKYNYFEGFHLLVNYWRYIYIYMQIQNAKM